MKTISIDKITKVYKLYDRPVDRLKESLNPFHKTYHRDFHALNNVSFEVEKGETVGIIGTNGSGKSTLLKIITGVLTQTSGKIKVDGKVAALLELGAGFNLEYTGIENIYMNGTILGYTKKEMEVKIKDILEFADIGDFVYQPIKTYSSGMLVRLAFSLSINVEPEVLIIDEALAVGDAFFQAKCYNKLEEIKNSGTTILFVSHDIASVKKLCNRAIWLNNGTIKDLGDAKTICEKYLKVQIEEQNRQNGKIVNNMYLGDMVKEVAESNEVITIPKLDVSKAVEISGTGDADILSFYIKDSKGNAVTILESNQEYQFGLVAKFYKDLDNILLGFELESLKGVKLFSINNFLTNQVIKSVKNTEVINVVFTLLMPKICSGQYLVSLSIAAGSQRNHVVIQRMHNVELITVESEGYNLSLLELDTNVSCLKYNEKNIRYL